MDVVLVFGGHGCLGRLRHFARFLFGHPAGERVGISHLARQLLVHHVLHHPHLLVDGDAAAALAHPADQLADHVGVRLAHAAGACIGGGSGRVGDALPLDTAEERLPPLALVREVRGIVPAVLPRPLCLSLRSIRECPGVGRVGDPVEVVPVAGAGQPRAGELLAKRAVATARAVIGNVCRPRGFSPCRLCVRSVELQPRGVVARRRLCSIIPARL